MTPRAERPNTVDRGLVLKSCTNVQLIRPCFANEMASTWRFLADSPIISEKDAKVYRLIAEMFEARAKEVI